MAATWQSLGEEALGVMMRDALRLTCADGLSAQAVRNMLYTSKTMRGCGQETLLGLPAALLALMKERAGADVAALLFPLLHKSKQLDVLASFPMEALPGGELQDVVPGVEDCFISACHGHLPSLTRLGIRFVKVMPGNAKQCWELAAGRGCGDAFAQLGYARLVGVPGFQKDRRVANELFLRAAGQRNRTGLLYSATRLLHAVHHSPERFTHASPATKPENVRKLALQWINTAVRGRPTLERIYKDGVGGVDSVDLDKASKYFNDAVGANAVPPFSTEYRA